MFVAIDPGACGAIAWLSDGGHLIEVRDLPYSKEGVMCAVLAEWVTAAGRRPVRGFLERVAARPGAGVSGMFNFGRGYGHIEGVLAACGIPVDRVTPAAWKGALRLSKDKNASRARAAEMWPGLAGCFARVKDDGRAEAALLGMYGIQAMRRAA